MPARFQMNDRGQIAAGKRADLLLVDGDPTTRISDLGNITARPSAREQTAPDAL
jgi:imidazolonepropionase-like amidohydrolase